MSEVLFCVTNLSGDWWVLALGTLWKCHCELSDLTTGYLGRLSGLESWYLTVVLCTITYQETFSGEEWRTSGDWRHTATTNLLLLSLMISSSVFTQLFLVPCSMFHPFANCWTIGREGIKLTTKRLSREKFDPWSCINLYTANFLAFRLENIDIIPRNSHFLGIFIII